MATTVAGGVGQPALMAMPEEGQAATLFHGESRLDLFEVMGTMRAMRRLSSELVPDQLVRELVQAALWAPSASRDRGQAFIVVTDRAQIRRLDGLWRRVVDFYLAALAPATAGYGTDPHVVRMYDAIRYQRDHFEETPVVIVACYDQRAFARRLRGRMPALVRALPRLGLRRSLALMARFYALSKVQEAASIYPAIENLLLAARARGLAANLTVWHWFAEGDLRSILAIPNDVQTYGVIPLGWPLGQFGPVGARPLDEAIHRDRW